MYVIIDTNFLLIPATLGVDIFAQIQELLPTHKLAVVDRTIEELNEIRVSQLQKRKDKNAAKMGLALLKAKNVETLPTTEHKHTDLLILEMARDKGYIVATQDKGLKLRLRANQVPVIYLRQKKYIRMEPEP